jgi:glycosyltransferase involved in cell wall biosynthesis
VEPLVTLGIPTYNRPKLLKQVIDRILVQTYTNFEVIISDDCSTDGTTAAYLDSLTDPRIRILRQPKNLGTIGNVNAILEAVRGEYFSVMADDDFLEPTWIEEHMAAFKAHPEVLFVHSLATCFDGINYSPRPAQLPPVQDGVEWIVDFFKMRCNLLGCTALYRSREYLAAGKFSKERPFTHDTILWMRLALKGKVAFIPRFLSVYLAQAGSLTSGASISALYTDMLKLIVDLGHEMALANIDGQRIARVMDAALTWSRRRIATQLLRMAQTSGSRPFIAREAWKFRRELLADWYLALPCTIATLILPFGLLSWLRKAHFALNHIRGGEAVGGAAPGKIELSH